MEWRDRLDDSPMAKSSCRGRRSFPRLRLEIPARLITHHGSYPTRLDNLSETGAHLSVARPERFTQCVPRWLSFEAMGKLVWMRAGYCGISFDRPLAEEWVYQTRTEAPNVPEGLKLPVR